MITCKKLSGEPVVGELRCNFSPDRVFSARECCGCSDFVYCDARFKIKVYADLSREDRIENLIRDIHQLNIDKSIEQGDFKAVMEQMLKFDIATIEREFHQKQNQIRSCNTDAISSSLGSKKMVLDGTVIELGEKIGKFVFGEKNSKGNHLFKTDCVTLAKCIFECCVTVDKKSFNLDTLVKYLGKGRKLVVKDVKTPEKEADN